MDKYYLTTAIDYVNGAPHIGHAYEKILTDIIARHYSQRHINARAFFSGKRELAGLYPERLPIAPPQARFQGRIQRQERIQGVRRVLLR